MIIKIYLKIFSQVLMFNVFFCSIFTRNKMLNKFINVVIIKDGRSIIEKIATKNNPAPSPFPDEVISM